MLQQGQFQAVEGQFYGSPKELWGFRYPTKRAPPLERARQFLREHARLLRLSPWLDDLECRSIRQSLGATHVVFEQRFHDAAVHRGEVTVHLDRRGAVYLVKNRAAPDEVQPEGPAFRLEPSAAARIARESVGQGAKVAGTVERLWFPVRAHVEPAYHLRVRRLKPREMWEVIVHAVSGVILWKYDNLSAATPRARVFNPSPVAVLGDHRPLLGPRRGVRQPPPSTYTEVRLLGLDKSGYLRGSRVRVESTLRPQLIRRKNRQFFFKADEPGFEHVMAYFHVDGAMRYLESLGYSGGLRLFRKPITVDARSSPEDNAYYDPDTQTLIFGTGFIDEAEDAETILHEFGHAVQDAACPGFGMSAEAAAMGEGFGDYFAASFFERDKPERYKLAVMAWDGLLIGLEEEREPPCMRRIDSRATYDDFKPRGDEHENGEIWSATLWELRRVLGRKKADRLIVESHFQLDPFTTFARGARAILDANDNLNRGLKARALRNVFKRRAIDITGA
jgi:Zn-dependent metalloprotease